MILNKERWVRIEEEIRRDAALERIIKNDY
jgi:hypothetical protein